MPQLPMQLFRPRTQEDELSDAADDPGHGLATDPVVGTEVEVHVGYTDTWERGFSVAESLPEGLRLRRRSDLQVLPVVFGADRVRLVRN
ncbi:MAG: hypothetical protein ACR2OH_06070 [Microthrixaceae bacterium]